MILPSGNKANELKTAHLLRCQLNLSVKDQLM
jgi:hypothetical protein